MAKYTKKPVEIEAIQWDKTDDKTREPVLEWLIAHKASFVYDGEHHELSIITLEGQMVVSHQDFVIKGIQGEFYPCKPDIFTASYDKV